MGDDSTGKPKGIKTPEAMWDLFEAYRSEVKDNPRKKIVFVGKEGSREEEPLERPLTIEGFRSFGHRNGKSVEHYFANTDQAYNDYRTVCSRIRDEIRLDQIEGGMVGQYNPSITQRLNGLTDKQESTVKVEVIETTLDLGNEIPADNSAAGV